MKAYPHGGERFCLQDLKTSLVVIYVANLSFPTVLSITNSRFFSLSFLTAQPEVHAGNCCC